MNRAIFIKRRKKEEGRGKKEEGRRKKEEGRRKKAVVILYILLRKSIFPFFGKFGG
ncbi:hypothetical protein K4039_08965 [Lyngbya sp. CCAP 1446/10]|uniref:hypothetical protein n=1 Tax=Lyngbya sp. CCAP 1446/10 TaxID=439293 RepID=UPI002237368E|nr:hypothetical protein [Lyngbya sp. CCAP 1446/10]MCW6050210.1 hypothetical protein [Lyngbya sp. CCAP 1446/10]